MSNFLLDHSTMKSHGEFDAWTPSSRDIRLRQWVTKTIEVVGVDAYEVTDSRKTRGQKQCGSVYVIGCVLEACDLGTHVDAHGWLEWENVMVDEYTSLMKNKTWDLVPLLQWNNVVKCQWV